VQVLTIFISTVLRSCISLSQDVTLFIYVLHSTNQRRLVDAVGKGLSRLNGNGKIAGSNPRAAEFIGR